MAIAALALAICSPGCSRRSAAFTADAQPSIDQARAFVHDLAAQQFDAALKRCAGTPFQSVRTLRAATQDAGLQPNSIHQEQYRPIYRRRRDGKIILWRIDAKLTAPDRSARYGQFLLSPDPAGVPKIEEYHIESCDADFNLGVLYGHQPNDPEFEFAPDVTQLRH